LIATTVNVYAVPFVKPVNVQERFAVFVQPAGAVTEGEDVTVYPEISAPPFDAGADQDTLACAFPAVAVTPVGDPGTELAATGGLINTSKLKFVREAHVPTVEQKVQSEWVPVLFPKPISEVTPEL
jgi:hypothetical protein